MLKSIFKVLLLIVVTILPFIGTVFLSRYAPYQANTFGVGSYLGVCMAYAFVSFLLLWLVHSKALPGALFLAGLLLYALGAIVATALAMGPPQSGQSMLQHPEIEQSRYIVLIIGVLMATSAFILVLKNKWTELPSWYRYLPLLFIPALAELMWELVHHYSAGAHFKEWVNQGKDEAKFPAHFDNAFIIAVGAIGRFLQYVSIACFAWMLFRARHIRNWGFWVIAIFCLLGLFSATLILLKGIPLPTAFQLLTIFFIPAGPMLLLFWLGVGLSTRLEGKRELKV